MNNKIDKTHYLIEAEIVKQLSKLIPDIIVELSSRFSRDDILFDHDGNIISVELKSLDLREFKKLIDEISEKYNIAADINPLTNILRQIESIKSYGLKGKKRNYIGYNKERKVQNRKQKIRNRGIFFYAQNHEYSSKNIELPDRDLNKIICGDSETVLRRFPDNCIDLVFTSPPYNFGLDYDEGDDGIDWNAYFSKLFSVFDQCIRVLKYGGRIIVNVQPLFSDYIPIHHIISNHFIQHKLIWKGEILWNKHNYNCKYTAWGSWKSPSSPYLKYTWEFVEIFAKGTITKKGDKDNIDITADEFKEYVFAEWSIAPERNMRKFGHPAMFPEELASRVMKLFSYKNDVILDPFNGVGTTTTVAYKLRRRYLGIDTSQDYCDKANERIKAAGAQLKLV